MKGKRFLALVVLLSLILQVTGPGAGIPGNIPPADAALPPKAAPGQAKAGGEETELLPSSVENTATLSSSAGLSTDWWTGVQEDIHQSEYQVSWQDHTYLPDVPTAYQAPNRAHNLRTYFTPEGIRVIPRTCGEQTCDSPPWQWALGLDHYVRGQERPAVSTAELVTATHRVEYRRDNLSEWYVNDGRGLVQGFTLAAPIPDPRPVPWPYHREATSTIPLSVSSQYVGGICDPPDRRGCPPGRCIDLKDRDLPLLGTKERQGPVAVRLALYLSTTLTPTLDESGRAIDFITSSGQRVLSYDDLWATDAAGRLLPTRFSLSPGQIAISLTLDEVRYPVTISATLRGVIVSPLGLSSGPAWTAEGDQAGANLGYAVSTAGDVDGDGYSDVIVGAPGYDSGEADAGQVLLYYGSPAGLGTNPGWSAEGGQPGENLGQALGIAGDVNGDGYADVLVGAPGYDLTVTGVLTDAGRAYLYLGSPGGLGITPTWSVSGDQVGAALGASLSTAGDVDGDGFGDVLVGTPAYDISGTETLTDGGRVYLYRGSAVGLSPTADWTASGDQAGAWFGASMGTAGDVDGDGYADVIVGAPNYDISATGILTDAGQVYLYLGAPTGLSPIADWITAGDQAGAALGSTVDTAGDVDGDGYADVIVGAPRYDVSATGILTDAGQVDLYAGSAAGPGITATWTAAGDQSAAQFGRALAPAGDVNGDGYADVLVGAPYYDNGEVDEGRAYVYYGSTTGLATMASWTAESDQTEAHLGFSVSPAGGVDGDGFSDVLVGAPNYDGGQPSAGRAYLYAGAPGTLGQSSGWSAEGNQAGARFGFSVGTAGDVNGDGHSDVVVGARYYDNGQSNEGRAYVYYGSASGLSLSPNWTAEGNQAGAEFGFSVGTAGDVNGDGYADVIVGAPYYDRGQSNEGRAYVYYGSSTGLSPVANWIAESNQGVALFGYAVGTAGDVNGDGYADIIVAAPYYNNGQSDEGRVYAYYGSAVGLSDSPDWTTESDQASALMGYAVGTAGDVNGDGYADAIVSAHYYDNGESNEGVVQVYYGSAFGLNTVADWQVESNQVGAQLGCSAGTAGDTNGDGYADVVIGASLYDNGETNEGAIFVYHGSASGLSTTPDWAAESDVGGARLGRPAGTAGDVNGDGYADLIAGALFYSNGQNEEGVAFLYVGSASGLSTDPAWAVESDQAGARMGMVNTAGDTNGDGYADVVVGAHYYDNGQTNEGAVFLYYGNEGDGLGVLPRQMRSDGLVPIASLGMSDAETAFQLGLTGRMPLGREEVKLDWQVAPLGTPFTATSGVISGTTVIWIDTLTSGVVITEDVAGLTPNTPYHWRVRLGYRPGNRLGQAFGRWVHIPWNGWNEQDLRTPEAIAGLVAMNDSPTLLRLATSLTATITAGTNVSYAWAFGDGSFDNGAVVSHIYPTVGVYMAVVTASNNISELTATTAVTITPACLVRLNDDPTNYPTVQAAVDASTYPTDVVKVAGTCDIVNDYGGLAQVVYLSKTLTIRGGYDAVFSEPPDPEANPTTLDAQGQGRVLYIAGNISPTIEGLRITGGDATGLGVVLFWEGIGGGIYILAATATLNDNHIFNNYAQGGGGGLYLNSSAAVLEGNSITANTTSSDDMGDGAGLYLYKSPATLIGNTISDNIADGYGYGGGGLLLYESDAILTGNTVSGNTSNSYYAIGGGGLLLVRSSATLVSNTVSANTTNAGYSSHGSGGGVCLFLSPATLIGNVISDNISAYWLGGGLGLHESDATLTNNIITNNVASLGGGGLSLYQSAAILEKNTISTNTADYCGGGVDSVESTATLIGNTISANTTTDAVWGIGGGVCLEESNDTLINNIVVDNQAGAAGSGLYVYSSSPRLLHNTFARNSGGDGSAIYLTEGYAGYSHIALTNTILVSHSVGVYVESGNTVTLEGTLWANGTDWSGPGSIVTGTVNLWGDPAFVDPDGGDYHIGFDSVAIDAGVFHSINIDIDGQFRPTAWGYDLGADEYPGIGLDLDKRFHWPQPLPPNLGQAFTYTIALTGAGSGTNHGVILTDTLPLLQRALAADASTGSCTIQGIWGGIVVCPLGDINLGQSAAITITAEFSTSALPRQRVVNHVLARSGEALNEDWVTTYAQDCHVRLNEDPTEYHYVQAAVDAAVPGDTVKIAGTCLGTLERAGLHQQVYLSKSLTLRGGYRTDFGDWNLAAYPTTLEALGQGRVLYILGEISPTVESLHLTGGDASGQSSPLGGGTSGGGIYVLSATATISGCQIVDNYTPDRGGGIFLQSSASSIVGNTISVNRADDNGGGFYLFLSPAVLDGNTIANNTAYQRGGGIYLNQSPATLRGNTVLGNWVRASYDSRGGGLYLTLSEALLVNNIVVDNRSNHKGSGLYIMRSSPRLLHTTIARNVGGSGHGLYIDDCCGTTSTVHMTNTILVSQSIGIQVTTDNAATLEGTLWGSGRWANGTDWTGGGTLLTGTVNLWGDPAFQGPDAGNYHIHRPSAALDAGVDAGVTIDIDGETRPVGPGYDIGADELLADLFVTKWASSDPVPAGSALTYTLCLTNSGYITLSATISDVLPAHVTPGGVLTWTAQLPPGGVWTETVVVTVELGYAGPLTNALYVTTEEGATGAYVLVVTAEEVIAGLTATNDSPTLLGSSTTLTATVTAGDPVSYTWAFGDGGTDSGALVTHTYLAVGVYAAVVTAGNDLGHLTATTVVTIIDVPIAGLTAINDSPTKLGLSTTLTATITAGTNVSYTWAFGDGALGNGAVVVHVYPAVGVYAAVVTGSNSSGQVTATTAVTMYRTCWARLNDDPTDYWTVQAAVDASTSPTDTVKVAGTCDIVNDYGGLAQVVYLSKTLTIRGGYTVTDWTVPDPSANPTTLDAQGQGRVLYIVGNISPTIEGLRLTGGDAAGLGGGLWGYDTGGGIYILTATATLSDNHVFSNLAQDGAGLYLDNSAATIVGNTITTNTSSSYDGKGGGLFLYRSDATLTGNTVSGNIVTSSDWGGGGLFLYESSATLVSNTVSANTANTADYGGGGGLFLYKSPATLIGNTISGNITTGDPPGAGGGLFLLESDATLINNAIAANVADVGAGLYLILSAALLEGNTISANQGFAGGGVVLDESSAILKSNMISANTASACGGVDLRRSNATMIGNTISANVAAGAAWSFGGGICLGHSDDTLLNNIVADNQTAVVGSGLYAWGGSPRLLHNTFARNTGGDGSGIYVSNGDGSPTIIALTNTILVSHSVGLYVESGSTATLQGTLWGNETDWSGPGTVLTGTVNLWGDSAFVDPAGGDYHIGFDSAAKDTGVDAGILVDIDGQARPAGAGYDLGADEFPAALQGIKTASAALLQTGERLTYTLRLTNSGVVTLNATISDLLPAQVIPSGTLTWTAQLAPGGLWTQTVVVTTAAGYGGPLVNTVQVATEEGATGVYTCVTAVEEPIAGLVAVNDSPTALGDPTTLTATVTAGDPVAYSWELGDGTLGMGLVLTHTYPAVGVYTAVVTASNSFSLLTATTVVTVEEAVAGLVAVNDSPTVLGNPSTLTATITAGSNVIYGWAFGDGNTGNGALLVHIYPTAGVYTAVVTASNSVSLLTATTVVTIEEVITGLTAINDSPTALGSPTTLTATVTAGDPVAYAWAFGDGAGGSGAILTHVYPAMGVYTAVVTASNSVSLLTATTVVTVEEALAGLVAVNDSPTALGDPTTLTATVVAGSNVVYAWAFGDGAGGSGAVLTYTYPAAGVYTAVVTASNAVSLLTAITTVIVDEAVAGLSASNDSPTLLGSPTTLTATVTAGSNVSYTWDLGDGTFGNGAVVNHIYTATGVYTPAVTASNSVSVLTTTTVVTVGRPILSVTKTASDPGPVEGDIITYTIVVSNGGPIDATNAVISDTLPPELALAGPITLDPPGAGTVGTPPLLAYSLTLTAGNAIRLSFPVRVLDGSASGWPILNRAAVSSSEVLTPAWGTVRITATNHAPTLYDLATNAPIDENSWLTLTGSITDPGWLDTFTLQIAWGDGLSQTMAYPVGTTAFTASHCYPDDDPSGTPADIYTLSLVLSDDDGGTDTDTITITVHNVAPVVEAGPDQIVDEGQVLTFSGTFTDPGLLDSHTILWDLGDGTTLSGTLVPTHTYPGYGSYTATLTVSDDDSGVGDDTVQVTVTNLAPQAVDDSYSTPEDIPLAVTAPGVLLNDSDPGQYPLVALLLAPPSSGTLVLQSDGAFTYTPEPDWSGPVTFAYAASDGQLTDTATVAIIVGAVNDPPVADAGLDQSTFVDSPVSLDGSASYDPDGHLPLSYRWTQASGSPVVLSSAVISRPTFTAPLTPTVLGFALVVTDAAGLPDPTPDSVVITVSDVPIADLTATNDSPTALGTPTTLTATLTAGSNVSYTWDLGDGTFGNGAVVSHTYTATGVYTPAVTANNPVSVLTATTTVVVQEPIAGLAAANDSPTLLGTPTTLTATLTAGSNVSYTWAFGDGTSGSGAVVVHTWPVAMTCTAVVTASNSVSTLMAATVVTITEPVLPVFAIYLPLVLRGR